ncbi:TetR/AcrR family transcriptional regulator [Lysinibacillus odysseyi]|uniref:HTH tetR-type domain-containing protein n=1 Tax=Lysinibacillus odysseyi 34hs-1 = NBRC 100172 TaxID=1220589 RepID=A0A0A3INR9_9BACI|nr:TetR/AcrR family transcriptional regulator [Lysinibacillus odysseyi]KGR84473.1 hypothetical protein CD32_12885 [Lysinibacillus odysseyi 34hs-1 = NBRC 100172]
MVKVEKKQQRGEEKRSLIATEALKLFKEKGYKKVTVDEIVGVCGTSKGSFYHHYKSKAEILNEQFIIADKYYEKVYAELPAEIPAKERFRVFMEKMYRYLEETFGQEFLAVIYSTSLETETHVYFRTPDRKLFMLFEKLIAEILEEQESNLSLQELKVSFIQLAMGIIYYWCTLNDPQPLYVSAKAPIEHFLNGFR